MDNEVNHENPNNDNNGNQVDNSAIQHIVAQGIIDAMPYIIKTVKEAENNKTNSGSKRPPTEPSHSINNGPLLQLPIPKRRRTMSYGCSYKEFWSCKPMEFSGNDGAIAALGWIEKTEAVLKISKRAKEDKIMFASNLFKNSTIEWWNTILQSRGSDRVYNMEWEEFKNMAERKFCPPNEK